MSDGIHSGLNVGFGSDDSRDRVTENRARAAKAFGAKADRLTTVYQVHGIDVAVLKRPLEREEAPKADAMVTDRPDVMLGILTADCTPVLFHDAKAGVIGACHSGWRGSFAGISEATVSAMEKLGASRDNISASVGPCIARPSYEVDAGFRDTILSGPSGDEDLLIDPSGMVTSCSICRNMSAAGPWRPVLPRSSWWRATPWPKKNCFTAIAGRPFAANLITDGSCQRSC